jgi:hypothetical protein
MLEAEIDFWAALDQLVSSVSFWQFTMPNLSEAGW